MIDFPVYVAASLQGLAGCTRTCFWPEVSDLTDYAQGLMSFRFDSKLSHFARRAYLQIRLTAMNKI